MSTAPLSAIDRARIERLRDSIERWALADIKRAASPAVDLPRLAFVGIAAWIDALITLRHGRSHRGNPAHETWRAFFEGYWPERVADVERIRDSLRNALLHEYATRGVALTHDNPQAHGLVLDDQHTLDVGELLAEAERAYRRLLAHIECDAAVRGAVLERAEHLIAPGQVDTTAASFTTSRVVMTFPSTHAVSASPPQPRRRRRPPTT